MRINNLGNSNEEIREFDQGEVIWYVPRNYRLVIRCTITEVDDYFRMLSPTSYLFYDVDEPIGHFIAEDEIYCSREEAEEAVGPEDRYEEDLSTWRKRQVNFIVGTWEDSPNKEKDIETLLAAYPNKQQGEEWFLVPK